MLPRNRLFLALNILYLGSTAGTTIIVVLLPAYLLIRPLSKRLYYWLLCSYVGAIWYTCLAVSERLNGVRVVITGTLPPADVSLLLMSNHKCNLDWVYLWSAAFRTGGRRQIGYFAAIVKSVLRNIPIFGWAFKLIGFLFLSRSFEVDEPRIVRWARALSRNRTQPIWLVLYPEGTRYTAKGKAGSLEASKKLGVEAPRGELLLPRTKGFCLLMKILRSHFHSVIDMTIAYVGPDNEPLAWDDLGTDALFELLGGVLPVERVHIHFEVFPAMSLPEGADKLQTWCLARWKEKERLLEHLQEKGAFPVGKGQAVIETPPPPVGGQIITACGFVAVSLFYGWLLFVSSWVRWYTVAAVAGMAAVCYVDPPGW